MLTAKWAPKESKNSEKKIVASRFFLTTKELRAKSEGGRKESTSINLEYKERADIFITGTAKACRKDPNTPDLNALRW